MNKSYTTRAVSAVLAAVRNEHDFADWLAGVLAQAAGQLGRSDALVEGRPGSWEASLVDQLVKGTVGYGDEYLPRPAPEAPRPPGSTRSAAETPATRSSRGSSQPNQTSPRPRSATSSRARRGRG